jgi:hypothetical protein
MKIKLHTLIAAVGLMVGSLSGCAGHPAHTANMEPADLASVSNKTLCDAAFAQYGYQPTLAIEMEVARRGLDCRNFSFTVRR